MRIITLYGFFNKATVYEDSSYKSVFLHSSYIHILNFHRFLVRVSYLEIYNEEVRDLLGKDQMQRLEVKTKIQFQTKKVYLLI